MTSNPVYATNKALLADGVGRRLENFFWRIWSSAEIRHHIRGSQVAVLFSKISEGGFLRTTPTQSPRASRSLGSYRQPSYSDNALDSSPPNAQATSSRTQRSSSGAAEENRRNMGDLDDSSSHVPNSMTTSKRLKKEVSLPPSILKKSRAESSSQLFMNNTILSPTFDSLRRNQSSGRGEAVIPFGSALSDATVTEKGDGAGRREQLPSSSRNEKKPSISSRSKVPASEARTSGERNSRLPKDDQKPARTKPAVHAKTGASRRRPVMASRKSSQSSSSNASNVISPPCGKKVVSPSEPADWILDADARTHQLVRSSRSGSPHLSKHGAQDTADESSSSDEEEEEYADDGKNPLNDSLVDRDFRSKFASRIRPEPQLPPLERRPAQVLADSAPCQAASTTRFEQSKQRNGKSKRNVGFTDEIISLKPPGASAEEDDDNTPGPLPRTKSQLTLLLEQDRRKSGGNNSSKKSGRR